MRIGDRASDVARGSVLAGRSAATPSSAARRRTCHARLRRRRHPVRAGVRASPAGRSASRRDLPAVKSASGLEASALVRRPWRRRSNFSSRTLPARRIRVDLHLAHGAVRRDRPLHRRLGITTTTSSMRPSAWTMETVTGMSKTASFSCSQSKPTSAGPRSSDAVRNPRNRRCRRSTARRSDRASRPDSQLEGALQIVGAGLLELAIVVEPPQPSEERLVADDRRSMCSTAAPLL